MPVLVHNSAYPSLQAADEQGPAEEDFDELTYWNVWRQRKRPYSDLEDGSLVLLMDSWPGGGRLSWVVRARRVHKGVFAGWDDATKSLARWSGRSLREVRREPYTATKRARDAGIVLAWQASVVRRLDIPRPQALFVGRHGWAVLDDLTVIDLGLGDLLQGGGASRAPRSTDSERNRAVELYAVERALDWCAAAGLRDGRHVGDDGKPWDIEATDAAGHARFIEVKGSTGGPGPVMVTRNEVRAAGQHGDTHALVHVHSIGVRDDDDGRSQCDGGVLQVFDPWRPLDEELAAVAYEWKRQPAQTQ
ncbi:MAG: DUF3883 domain-containing protein [Actinomycetota bacterium]|nr:DUF3883 domain-containing protein [Actinomycetota bacterium]